MIAFVIGALVFIGALFLALGLIALLFSWKFWAVMFVIMALCGVVTKVSDYRDRRARVRK